MPWRLTGRWRSLSRRQLRYHRLVCESEISSSNPPVLFGPGGFFFARGARATYGGGAAQPSSCDSTFRTIRATGLLSADCGANLIWAKVTIPRATTRSAPDAAMRVKYFTGTSFCSFRKKLDAAGGRVDSTSAGSRCGTRRRRTRSSDCACRSDEFGALQYNTIISSHLRKTGLVQCTINVYSYAQCDIPSRADA